ncbi:hypothetical protein [Photorhabdus heterorhabditis]|uniref:hypothetical protein n=1 Tax=Photorhabdus heterorhabditis TaxID=880156 RepID=UPI001561FBF4|nr:hypothetical protein [Photorhabdus heterorhabditis]NRN27208.1 hypothetical protein [Photorhabdus heterorhabditis subsp. aluminescens]
MGQIAHEVGSFFRQGRGVVTMPNCRFARVELFARIKLLVRVERQDVQLYPIDFKPQCGGKRTHPQEHR